MATRVVARAEELLALNAALETAQQWIVPGELSLQLSLTQIGIERECRAVAKEVQKLQELHARRTEDGAMQEKPILRGGEQVGAEIVMKDRLAFDKAYRELMERDVTIEIPALLKPADLGARFTKDMLDDTAGLVPFRGASLAPIMEGFARAAIAPAAPATNGRKRVPTQ